VLFISFPILSPNCDYTFVKKRIVFIPILAQYKVISRYINIWNRNFMFARHNIVSSILTVSYQKNTVELDLRNFEAYKIQRYLHINRVNYDQLRISNV